GGKRCGENLHDGGGDVRALPVGQDVAVDTDARPARAHPRVHVDILCPLDLRYRRLQRPGAGRSLVGPAARGVVVTVLVDTLVDRTHLCRPRGVGQSDDLHADLAQGGQVAHVALVERLGRLL